MGNEMSASAQAAQKPCGLECNSQKQNDKAYADYVALAKDPDADPVETQKAKDQYDLLRKGHATAFHEQVAADATQANQTGKPSGSQQFLQDMTDRLEKLEQELESLDSESDRIAAEGKEIGLEIAKGQQMIVTLRRAIELKKQFGRGN